MNAASRRTFAYPKEGVFQPNSSQAPTQPAQYGAPLPPPPAPQGRSRWIPHWSTILTALVFTTVGAMQVQSMLDEFVVSVPTEEEDAEDLADMIAAFDELPLVQSLRSSWRLVDGKRVPLWKEWIAYQALTEPARRAERLTTGPLAGSHGVAAQRIFLNEENGSMVHFVCFGAGTTGWPGIVHGGAISTIIDESFGRFAARKVEARTAITASLELSYVQKSVPGEWYVIILGLDDDHKDEQTDKKKYMAGVMACLEDGNLKYSDGNFDSVHPHVLAKALYVVPKAVKLPVIPDEF